MARNFMIYVLLISSAFCFIVALDFYDNPPAFVGWVVSALAWLYSAIVVWITEKTINKLKEIVRIRYKGGRF